MENSLVSVIIPIYNVSEYLDACVQSACGQTYSRLEIILVDDGSPDDCPAKCDHWKEKDSRIKVIHKANGGLSDARNAGLDAAAGKYVYFLDGDDTINPRLVEKAVGHMEDGTDLVAFHYNMVFPDGRVKPVLYHELGCYELPDAQARLRFVLEMLLSGKLGWEAWSRMYSRELIEKYQLRFADNRVIFAEDLYFCLCYCAHAERVISISDILYNYAQRDNSIMGRDGGKLNVGRMNELAKAALTQFQKFESCQEFIRCFPAIHYLIIDNVLSRAMQATKLSHREFRQAVLDDIKDLPFFRAQVKRLPHYRACLALCFSGSQAEERLSYMRYLLDGNYTALRIRNRLIYRFADALDRNTPPMRELRQSYRELAKEKHRIFLLGTEEFGNIGDNQINESVVAFLKKTLPKHTLHEVTAREWPVQRALLKKYIRNNDLIVFAGGGNFGDTYSSAQRLRADVIRTWPQIPKIVFPQTIYFSDSAEGAELLAETRALYTRENRVVLFAREKASFDFAQAQFSCDSYLAPDIVLSAGIPPGTSRERGALLCFRQDIEKTISDETISEIEQLCRSYHCAAAYTDLQLDYHVNRSERKAIIKEKLDLWRQAQVVITDRLHGMVFAAVTGTPCIVFSNFNHKVQGTYEWINYLPYIRYAETAEDVRQYLPELLSMEDCRFDGEPLAPYFENLAQVVRAYANN